MLTTPCIYLFKTKLLPSYSQTSFFLPFTYMFVLVNERSILLKAHIC